jgi:cephalosporin hydroxylase
VVVGDEVERRVMLFLKLDELSQRTKIIAEMEILTRWLGAGEYA